MDPNNIRMREFIYSLIDIKPNITILDLGCGQGYDLFRISELLDDGSRLVGIDSMENSIIKAKKNYGQDVRINFINHNFAQDIPFNDDSFDLVISNNMLECIKDKQHLLREVHRVLKPEGQVIFAHFDWDSQLIDGDNKALIRTITQTFNDWKQDWMDDIDSWMGRRLWRTFQDSRLFTGKIETHVLTNTKFEEPYYGHMMIRDFESLVRRDMLKAEDYKGFLDNVEILNKSDQFFYSITMYIYVGAKS
ncbi:ubiquinone/menaquinone biosynthesis C-methylase UbiE [Paenibacillus endophyticus]|uniref:Ubiquinone/menaquinone biosynthesis C-methylase UbiE n=1 Tax=Paenibacillus endophyticus TaxID=1294268 RepID=A0A7W5C4J7_9BACL|nr:methyltransferase domain-containing protein [Paenibacillus endophyticus]MBB3151082.1 ubiquinone/menaquinone biosynthesis C-methylase UbiE [Paenibacillus endophyticus]